MTLLFDARWIGEHGIGRFAREVRAGLPDAYDFHGRIKPSSPVDPLSLSMQLMKRSAVELFYSPGYNAPLLSRVPFIFTIHDLNHIDFEGSRSGAKSAYYAHVMKPACRRARAVITVSEYSRRRICEWSGLDEAAVVNVGNGVSAAFSTGEAKYEHTAPYLLCVGNRKAHKNEERAVSAFARVAKRLPHDLLFTGRPSRVLLEKATALGVEHRMHFLGTLTEQELVGVYRGASAVLFVSLYEGFGLPVIEAMACGTPVITSTVCSLPEVAGGAALLVDPHSVDAIAAAIERLALDHPHRQRLIAQGLVNARRFTWEKTCRGVREVIEKHRS